MEDKLDFSAHYTVDGMAGVAWYLLGYATEVVETCEEDIGGDGETIYYYDTEEVSDLCNVRAVMVGDDRVHIVGVDELTIIPEDGFCRECGQTGCGHNVYV